jgi:hypothetical protein
MLENGVSVYPLVRNKKLDKSIHEDLAQTERGDTDQFQRLFTSAICRDLAFQTLNESRYRTIRHWNYSSLGSFGAPTEQNL